MYKDLTFGDDARHKIAKGVQKLADAVQVTMGPSGKTVLIQKKYRSILTKDGVSVANEVHLQDTIENIGAQLIKEVANNVALEAGDGTTTATVLANSIFQEGLRSVTSGANPVEIKKGMDKCLEVILKTLKENSKQITTNLEIEQVATISANGDSNIGKMISEAMERVGKDGIITVEEGKGLNDELTVVQGMQIPRGYLSPYFVTDTSKLEVQFDDALLLLLNQKIIDLQEVLPALSYAQEKKQPLLIICDDVEGDALNTLVLNKMRKILNVCVIKSPGFSDTKKSYLEDIAVLTGGSVIDRGSDILLTSPNQQLGKAVKVTVSKDKCLIIGDDSTNEAVSERVELIRDQMEKEKEPHFKGIFKERLAKLTGGIAVIKVSSPSETETKERKDRVDDALGATKAAQDEGIIIGGGCALIKTLFDVNLLELDEDQKLGANIILKSIQAPISRIVENAGYNAGVVIEMVQNSDKEYTDKSTGFNAAKNEYVNMYEAGIIDAYKVCRCALENAVSVASTLLTTECIISTVED